MKKLDKEGNINWVDITRDKAALAKAGLTYKQAMDRMHVIRKSATAIGRTRLFTSLEAASLLRASAPIIENVPLLLPLMEFCYRIFARYRLPLTGKKQINSYHESNKPQ